MDSIVQCFVFCFIFLCLTTASFSTQPESSDPGGKTYVFLGYKPKFVSLDCPLQTTNQLTLQWTKNNIIIDITSSENKDHYKSEVVDNKEKLTINHPTDKDIGNYSCQLHNAIAAASNTSGTALSVMVYYFEVLSELLVRMESSVTVIEGEELKLKCLVTSKSLPHHIYWEVGNETYEDSRGRVELKEDEKHIPNAIFSIKESVAEDRGTYTCLAYATESATNATKAETYVRVKDKLAALWPFLGICAEVVVLCAIILIYEKKRNKAELEESDTDQSPDQKNTPDLGKDSVRQRK